MNKKIVLMVVDGFGINNKDTLNPINLVKMPNYNRIKEENLNSVIIVDETGLAENQKNSIEYGYLNLLNMEKTDSACKKIDDLIEKGEFFINPILQKTYDRLKKEDKALHLIGSISDFGRKW